MFVRPIDTKIHPLVYESFAGLAPGRPRHSNRLRIEKWKRPGSADVVELQAPEASFDAVVVMYLHLPAEQRRQVLSHSASSLAPGGVLLVVGHESSNPLKGTGGPQDPSVLFGPEDIVEDLSGLGIERAERVTRTAVTDAGEAPADRRAGSRSTALLI